MAEEDIVSPPFPGDYANAADVLDKLRKLRGWIMLVRTDLMKAMKLDPDHARDPDDAPLVEQWRRAPMVQVTAVFWNMRDIRANFDGIVRDHEDSWNSKPALVRRYKLLQKAYDCLHSSSLDREQFEASIHEQLQASEVRSVPEHVVAFLNALMNAGHRGG